MEIVYHDELNIYVNDDLLYKGKSLIYNDNYCEGIVYDKNNNKKYICGTFIKTQEIDLTIVDDNKIERFKAKKSILKYIGEYSIIEDNVVNKMPFYLIAPGLDVDPRDYVLADRPSTIFKEELDNYKKEMGIDNNQGQALTL